MAEEEGVGKNSDALWFTLNVGRCLKSLVNTVSV